MGLAVGGRGRHSGNPVSKERWEGIVVSVVWGEGAGPSLPPNLCLLFQACFGAALGPLYLEPCVSISHEPNLTHILPFSCALSNVKKVSLELGGKSPLIIFADCDLSKAVQMVRDSRGEKGGSKLGWGDRKLSLILQLNLYI